MSLVSALRSCIGTGSAGLFLTSDRALSIATATELDLGARDRYITVCARA